MQVTELDWFKLEALFLLKRLILPELHALQPTEK
jgi:hypothetical protein